MKTDIDFDVDDASLFPRSFSFEKMFGGKFMGEIVHRILRKLVEQGVVCNGKVTNQLAGTNYLRSRTIQEIDR